MAIIRAPRPEAGFYTLDKRISEDKRLSWAARGLLIFLLGKPDHWRVSVEALRNETAETTKPTGRDGVYSLLSELMAAGYVARTQGRAEGGRLAETDYTVNETPLPASPLPAAPYTAAPYPANPTQVNTEEKQETEEEQGLKESHDRKAAATKPAKSRPSQIKWNPQTLAFDGIDDYLFGRLQNMAPLVDVRAEITRAAVWCGDHPSRAPRTKASGFLSRWMTRAQDDATRRSTPHAAHPRTPPRRTVTDERAEWLSRATGRGPAGPAPSGDFIDV